MQRLPVLRLVVLALAVPMQLAAQQAGPPVTEVEVVIVYAIGTGSDTIAAPDTQRDRPGRALS
jgi:hypothetical protein